MSNPPFDTIKGAFWLIVGVIGVEMLVVLSMTGTCVYLIVHNVPIVDACRGLGERVSGMIGDVLAVALALFGLREYKRRENGKPPPAGDRPPPIKDLDDGSET